MNDTTELVKATSDELSTCKNIVYMIVNKINNKYYIGISSTSFYRRYSVGLEKHHNSHLRRAIEKYGVENFDIILLEKEVENEEQLIKLEIGYIKKYQTVNPKYGYNKSYGGDGQLGVKFTEETKRKISEWHIGFNSLANLTEEQMKERSRKLSIAHSGKNNAMYNRKDKTTPEEYEQWRKSCARPGKNNGMYGKKLKDHMTEEAYEQWKINVTKCKYGGQNGRARRRIVVCKGTKYTFDCAVDAINHFRGEGYPFLKQWFYKGIPEKHKGTFQFVGYEEDFNTI